jgi:hypothetical protein
MTQKIVPHLWFDNRGISTPAVIVTVVVLAAIAAGAWWWQQEKEAELRESASGTIRQEQGSRVYTSTQNGFEVMLPVGWVVTAYNEFRSPEAQRLVREDAEIIAQYPTAPVTRGVVFSSDVTADDQIAEHLGYVTINGIQWEKLLVSGNAAIVEYRANIDGRRYSFSQIEPGEDIETLLATFRPL